jgi:hypothetical protein
MIKLRSKSLTKIYFKMYHKYGTAFCLILVFLLLKSLAACTTTEADTTYYELWYIDTLENIGGHPTTIIGNPLVVSTDLGRAVQFDGNGDMLLVDANPLGETKEFTIEIIFKPEGAYPLNADPRFVHIQDPDDPQARRVMIELRITDENTWYLDGYMNTDNASLTLIDASLTHPVNQWMHAAVTYQNSIFTTWVNGIKELNGNVTCLSAIVAPDAKTSLGARMNQKNFYRGIIRSLKVTHRVLAPDEFLLADTNVTYLNEFRPAGFYVCPNPAGQFVTIMSFPVCSPVLIKVINVLGKTIYREKLIPASAVSHKIDTSCFPEGIYLIEMNTGNCFQTERLVIRR